jgi:YVTN family beta-propeller protein
VRSASVACLPADGTWQSARGVQADVIFRKQQQVKLTSSDVSIDGNVFEFQATVQNLTQQVLGTADGVTPDPNGVRVFFIQQPSPIASAGHVTVIGVDGAAHFTADDQLFYSYAGADLGGDGVLSPGEVSGSKFWAFDFSAGVENFTFKVAVSTAAPHESAWIDVVPFLAGDDALIQEGDTLPLHAVFYRTTGDSVAASYKWSSSNVSVARVDAHGVVTGLQHGTTQGTAVISATHKGVTGQITITVDPISPRIYVANSGSNSVSVVNPAGDPITTIAGLAGPVAVAFTPNGRRALVVEQNSGSVAIIDVTHSTVLTEITVGPQPNAVAVNRTGTKAYVANGGNSTVSVIDLATNTVSATVTVGDGPTDIAVRGNAFVYVVNRDSNTVSVIDAATNTVVATIVVPGAPHGIAITPNRKRAYVTHDGGAGYSGYTTLNLVSNTVISSMSAGSSPWFVAVSGDGTRVLGTEFNGGVVRDIPGAQTIDVPNNPWGIAFSADGNTAYVARWTASSLAVIDLTTTPYTVSNHVVGSLPEGVAVKP